MSFIINSFRYGVAAPSAFILEEDCEGTGAPSGWTDSGGTFNWDDTTTSIAPLVGSESLSVEGGSFGTQEYVQKTFDSTDEATIGVYFVFAFYAGPTGDSSVIKILDSSDVVRLSLRFTSSDLLQVTIGESSNAVTGSTTLIIGTKYHLWLDIANSTGDDQFDLYLATSDTKPGSPEAGIAVTLGTITFSKARFGGSRANDNLFDKMRVDTSYIGSSPS